MVSSCRSWSGVSRVFISVRASYLFLIVKLEDGDWNGVLFFWGVNRDQRASSACPILEYDYWTTSLSLSLSLSTSDTKEPLLLAVQPLVVKGCPPVHILYRYLPLREGSRYSEQPTTWIKVSFLTSSVWVNASDISGDFPVLALWQVPTTIKSEVKSASPGCEPSSKVQYPACANCCDRMLLPDENMACFELSLHTLCESVRSLVQIHVWNTLPKHLSHARPWIQARAWTSSWHNLCVSFCFSPLHSTTYSWWLGSCIPYWSAHSLQEQHMACFHGNRSP